MIDNEQTNRTLNGPLGIDTDEIWVPNRRIASIRIADLEDRFNRIKNIVVPTTTTTTSSTPAGTPSQVTGVSATESPFRAQDGTLKSNVSVSFTVNPSDTFFDHAQVWFSGYNGNSNPQLMPGDARTSPASFLCDTTHETVTVTVVAVGSTGLSADFTFAPTTTVLLDGVTSAPPAPSISQTLVQTPTGYQFAFNQLTGLAADQIDGYRIWQNTTNNSSTATQIDYVKHNPTNGTAVTLQYTAANGVTNYYWVSAVNTTGLESTKTAAQSGTVSSGNPIDSSNIIVASGVDFTRAYLHKNVDNISDGATYGRPLLSRLSSGKPWIDFSEGIHANKILDNIADSSNYKKTTPNQIQYISSSTGQITAGTIVNTQGSIAPNQAVLISYSMPSSSVLIASWSAQSLLRTDSSTLNLVASAGATMILNGDGEAGTVGATAPSWSNVSGFNATTVSTPVHSGSKALNINNTTANTSLDGQTINVVGGQVYVVEGWIQTDALPTVAGHGGFLQVALNGGVTSFDEITSTIPSGGADQSTSTQIQIGFPANGATHSYAFFQAYFIPNANGQVILYLKNVCNGGNVYWDDVKFYPFSGGVWRSLSASTSYYLYPYIQVSDGTMHFTNGSPPGTSPSDTFAAQQGLDGRIQVLMKKITMPSAGSSGSDTGGGSGTCPEWRETVTARLYSDDGQLIFEGETEAKNVRLGYESDDGLEKRGWFLLGKSFRNDCDVWRAVQGYKHVPCAGWIRLEGKRVTACEHVFHNGSWKAAWTAQGASHETFPSYKVEIQVEADWDDEHNYYIGPKDNRLLIHNLILLPC